MSYDVPPRPSQGLRDLRRQTVGEERGDRRITDGQFRIGEQPQSRQDVGVDHRHDGSLDSLTGRGLELMDE